MKDDFKEIICTIFACLTSAGMICIFLVLLKLVLMFGKVIFR